MIILMIVSKYTNKHVQGLLHEISQVCYLKLKKIGSSQNILVQLIHEKDTKVYLSFASYIVITFLRVMVA